MKQKINNTIGGKKAKASSAVKTVILSALLLVYILPFLIILVNSFKGKRAIVRTPLVLIDPHGPTVQNFVKAFEKMDFVKSFMNSTVITVVSVALIILVASMTAYFFVRKNWMINKVIFAMMLTAMIIPFQVIMIPLVSIYGGQLGLLDHRATLIFMNVGFGVAMAVFIYHGFIKTGVPVSLEEAATIDGCNQVQIFFKIVFPLLKATTATVTVLDVLWIWNDYLLPSLVLTKKSLFTLPLSTYAFYGTYTIDYGAIMAALVLTTIPVIILYIFLQKQIISGVVAGAVKA